MIKFGLSILQAFYLIQIETIGGKQSNCFDSIQLHNIDNDIFKVTFNEFDIWNT